MHRKKIRRWHKLLSVSGIIVAAFGMLFIPTATAQPGGPVPMGIYGPSYSNRSQQMQYIDFPNDVVGLTTSDLYITGTAKDCVIGNLPGLTGFSFGVIVSGCGPGVYRLNLKAESVAYENGVTGPTYDYLGSDTTIDLTPLEISVASVNTSASTTADNGKAQWQVSLNHPIVTQPPFNFEVSGTGCTIEGTQTNSLGLLVQAIGCQQGTSAVLTLLAGSLTDSYGNIGPAQATASSPATVLYFVPVVTPSPTPTVEPTPTASPTAAPTAAPAPIPSSSPTPSDEPTSVAVANPPTEPPTPPNPPTAPESQPVTEPLSDATPIAEIQEQAPEPEQSVTLPPISVVRSKIVQVRKELAQPEALPTALKVSAPMPEAKPIVITPAIESEVKANFNWQPVGYLAIAVGGAGAAVGSALLLKRMLKVRKLRFS